MFGNSHPPLWLAACALAGVLAVGCLWWWAPRLGHAARGVLRAAGGVLLAVAVGRSLQRLVYPWSALGTRDFFDDDTGDRVQLAVLAVAGLVVGLLVSRYLLAVEEGDEGGGHDGDPEPVGAAELPPIDASAWSATEVLGEAPEREPWATELPPTVEPARRATTGNAAHLRRLALVTVGLALPIPDLSGSAGFSLLAALFGAFGLGREKVVPSTVAAYLLVGLAVGGALLGALARDDEDPGVLLWLFGLPAAGVGLTVAWPVTFFNQYWFFLGAGLAAGLLVPAATEVLARVLPEERRHLALGSVIVVLLFVATGLATGRAVSARERSRFESGQPAYRDVAPDS